MAKLRHTKITSGPGRIRVAGPPAAQPARAAALSQTLARTALKARTVLGFATVDVTTRPDAR